MDVNVTATAAPRVNTLQALLSAVISASNMVNTIAVRSDKILDHSLAMLEDVSANGHDYTSMVKLSDMTRRRQQFLTNNPDLKELPQSLQDILNMEIK